MTSSRLLARLRRAAAASVMVAVAVTLLAGAPAGAAAAEAPAAPAAPTQAASTSAGTPSVGGFLVRPAEVDPADPSTRAYFKLTARGGQVLTRHVVVANTGRRPVTHHVTAVDGLTAVTSGAVYANRDVPVAKTARWVRAEVDRVTLAPGESRHVSYTVTVPTGARAGDHLAGLAFEDAAPRSSGGQFAVTQVFRTVIGILVRVPGEAACRLDLGAPTLQRPQGLPGVRVVVPVRNEGGALGKPTLTVRLQGETGRSVVVERQLDTVLPQDRIDYPVTWPRPLAPGRYSVHVTSRCAGDAAAVRSEATLARPLGPDAAAGTGGRTTVDLAVDGQRTGTGMRTGVLVGLVLTVALLAAVLGARFARWRDRRPEPQGA